MTDEPHAPSFGEWLIVLAGLMLVQGYVLGQEHVDPEQFFAIPAGTWHAEWKIPA